MSELKFSVKPPVLCEPNCHWPKLLHLAQEPLNLSQKSQTLHGVSCWNIRPIPPQVFKCIHKEYVRICIRYTVENVCIFASV